MCSNKLRTWFRFNVGVGPSNERTQERQYLPYGLFSWVEQLRGSYVLAKHSRNPHPGCWKRCRSILQHLRVQTFRRHRRASSRVRSPLEQVVFDEEVHNYGQC